jgi:protein-tyrosine phosphatase
MSVADRGKYLLLELPYQQVPMQVDETIFQLRLAGLTPLMAHPERVAYYLEDIDRVEASVRIGALTQVTGASLTGRFGSKARDFAMAMLDRGLIHVLATDSHDVRHRPPVLSEAVRVVRERVGAEAALRLGEEIPRAILEGREIESEPPPRRSRERRGILGRLTGFLRRR